MENTFSTGMDCVPKNLMLDRSILGKPPSDTLAHRGGSPHAGMGMVSRMRWHGILWTVVALSVLVGAGVVLSEPLTAAPKIGRQCWWRSLVPSRAGRRIRIPRKPNPVQKVARGRIQRD